MNFIDVLLKKYSLELVTKLSNLSDNTFNIYKDRLVEINTILTDKYPRNNLKTTVINNLTSLYNTTDTFKDRRLNVFYFIYNLNNDII